MAEPHDLLVSTDWLEDHLDDPDVRVVDMRGYVVTRPLEPGVEHADYRRARGRIPRRPHPGRGLRRLDPRHRRPRRPGPGPGRPARSGSPRRWPSGGSATQTHVIAVDHAGGQFATRLWWALHYYGHDAVSVLQGGWNRWVDEGRPSSHRPRHAAPRRVHAPGPPRAPPHRRAARRAAWASPTCS